MSNSNNQSSPGGLMLRVREGFASARAGSAKVLRAMAGMSGGVRTNRRGTFMVVVIGTLALLAVIAIAHFAVGQADRRASASLARADRLSDTPDLFAKYVTDVLAQDLFLRIPEDVNAFIPDANRRLYRREAYDIPSTDWRAQWNVTEQQVAAGARSPFEFFSPAGLASDPWLASTEPTFLNYNPANPNNIRNDFQRNRDWAQITDIAPDGRFVNLFNLRNNFGAESGVGNDSRNRPRMSANLSLLRYNMDQQQNFNTLGWQKAQATDFNILSNNPGVSSRPATFASRQVGMFGPMRGKLANNINGGMADFPDYQLADADGDGFADSKWFELTDARDINNVFSILPKDDKVRWFFAARIIDLSGLVNVNTASDMRYGPSEATPIGLTPADIDLKRLLSMQDTYANVIVSGQPTGYDGILQPQALGLNNGANRADNYFTGQSGARYNQRTAAEVGTAAYAALRDSFDKRRTPLGTTAFTNDYDWPNSISVSVNDKKGILRAIGWRKYSRSGESMFFDESNNKYDAQAVFGMDDLAELLARHGSNDPMRTSRLESTLDGREFANPQNDGKRRFGVLRSNRAAEVEQTLLDNNGNIYPSAWVLRAADVRSKLTTISLSRPIRNLSGQLENDITVAPATNTFLEQRDGRISVTEKLTANSPIGAERLFEGYAKALAPAMAMPNIWPTQAGGGSYAGNDFEQRKTLFYGHNGPELALITSGAMALNAAVMLGHSPTEPYVLVLEQQLAQRLRNENQPKIFGNIPAFASFVSQNFCLDGQDATNPVLANGGTDFVQAPALNLYPITPQPVITGVGLLSAWVDSPRRPQNPSIGALSFWNGDLDASAPLNGRDPTNPITIGESISESNKDFLGRAMVIQLHNPFDRPVVTGIDNPNRAADSTSISEFEQFMYVRQLDKDEIRTERAYLLAEMVATNISDDTISSDRYEFHPITIGPGETIACVVFSDSPGQIIRHLRHADLTSPSLAVCKDFVFQDWINHQFKGAGVDRVVVVPRIKVPEESTPDADRDQANQIKDIVDYVNGGSTERFDELVEDGDTGTVFQVIQSVRYDTSTLGGRDERRPLHNEPANDRLLDRFRLPESESLDRRIETGSGGEVVGTLGGPQQPNRSIVPPRTDNSSVVVTRWAYAIRPSDPDVGDVDKRGIPAYCIEPKKWTGDWNKFESDPISGDWTLTASEIENHPELAFWSVHEFRAGQGSNDTPLMEDLAKEPKERSRNPIESNRHGKDFAEIRGAMPLHAKYDRGYGTESTPFTTDTPGSNNGKIPLLRTTDMLLPMGLTPMEAPVGPGPAYQYQRDMSKRWTTFSECLAIAYGYEEIPQVDGGSNNNPTKQDIRSVYADAKAMPGAANWGPRVDRLPLDNGQLVIDDFAPFFDNNRDGFFNGQDGDLRFGNGIPCALNILDVFSAIEPEYGSLSRPVSGQININTAPSAVLRTLPLLTPPDDSAWNTRLLTWTGSPTDATFDIAASLEGYRDKRPLEPWQSQNATRRKVDDGNNKVTFLDFDRTKTQGNVTPNNTTRLVGRARETQIVGIREDLGFASSGELLCVLQGRERDAFASSGTSNMTSRDRKGNIDTLGWDNADSSRLGITSQLRPVTPGGDTPEGFELSGHPNTYEQRLQIAAALSNTTTVRSDVFACWFVVRGYTKEDCEGLGPTDPMVPSIERRFLMVIDRSNVNQLGQQPKILLMQELPVVK